jgi:hypothetical protein
MGSRSVIPSRSVSGSVRERYGSADPDPLVRGTDPRIRIRTKCLWIWYTVRKDLSEWGAGR